MKTLMFCCCWVFWGVGVGGKLLVKVYYKMQYNDTQVCGGGGAGSNKNSISICIFLASF